MHLKDGGQPLRDAIAAVGLSLTELAQRTRTKDPEGRGLSKSAIGNLVATGSSSRTACHPRTARLISQALDSEIADFFNQTPAT